jgi:hypothetical protein
MRRAAMLLMNLGWLLLSPSPSTSETQTPTCYATVYNDYSGAVTIAVGRSWYPIPSGGMVQVPLTGQATLCVWSCVSSGCSWPCPATACPGGSYRVLRSGGPPEELTIWTDSPGFCGPVNFAQSPPSSSPTIAFTDNSPGATAWSWNFGDGATSSAQDPSHTYALQTCPSSAFIVSHWAGVGQACMGPTTQPVTMPGLRCVMPWSQGGASLWATDRYALHDRDDPLGADMRTWGCAVSAAAIFLNFLGVTSVTTSLGTEQLNPGSLNRYLTGVPDGYNESNEVNWQGRIAALAGADGADKYPDNSATRQTIDAELAAGRPVILDTGGHWVVLLGKATVDGVETYSIQDPGHNDRHFLTSYGNNFARGGAVLFSRPEAPGPVARSTLGYGSVVANVGGADLDVVDPLARHSATGAGLGIPGAINTSFVGFIDDTASDTLIHHGPRTVTTWIATPAAGEYTAIVSGSPGAIAYLTVFTYDSTGVLNLVKRDDLQLSAAGIDTVKFTYGRAPAGVDYLMASGFSLKAWPNPAPRGVRVAFVLPVESVVRLSAYDVLGRHVATIAEGRMTAGIHSAEWTSVSGAPLKAGIYLVKLQTVSRTLTVKVAVTR